MLALAGCNTETDGGDAGYFLIDEDRIYYEVSGQGFPLVLVSGGSGMDMRQWDLVSPVLAQSFRVIRFDPRGIGGSDNPAVRYSDADDIARLLDHLGVDQAGLIGVSSAGGLVLNFAILYPERTTGVVAAAPFVPGFEFSADMLARLDRFNQAAGQGRERFLDRMFEDAHFIPAPLDRSVRAVARENMAYNYDKSAGFDPDLQIQLLPPLIEQLANIRSPLLLLAGELDHPEVLRRNIFLAANILSAEEKIVVQAGHNAPLENPAAFLEAIRPFLATIVR